MKSGAFVSSDHGAWRIKLLKKCFFSSYGLSKHFIKIYNSCNRNGCVQYIHVQSILGQELGQNKDILLFPNMYKHGAPHWDVMLKEFVMLRTRNLLKVALCHCYV